LLSKHSPNFRNVIVSEQGSAEYSIRDYDYSNMIKLPVNLCLNSMDVPNFVKNDSLLFMTEDKIIKCY
jgi:hypothetical protein